MDDEPWDTHGELLDPTWLEKLMILVMVIVSQIFFQNKE